MDINNINNNDNDPDIDKDGCLHIKLSPDDSALLVHVDGSVEIISRDMLNNETGYLGDIEDLNKTFSLVLALAASLENEQLYNMIFDNLNHVLMKQWDGLDDDKKAIIAQIRKENEAKLTDAERKEKNKRVDGFRQRMSKSERQFLDNEKRRIMEDMKAEMDFMREQAGEPPFPDPSMHPQGMRMRPKRKMNPLAALHNVNWNPNDKSLTAHFKDYRADAPPDEEN